MSVSVSDITYLQVSASAYQETQAISTGNSMDCYISHLKPVPPLETSSVSSNCVCGILRLKAGENYKLEGALIFNFLTMRMDFWVGSESNELPEEKKKK